MSVVPDCGAWMMVEMLMVVVMVAVAGRRCSGVGRAVAPSGATPPGVSPAGATPAYTTYAYATATNSTYQCCRTGAATAAARHSPVATTATVSAHAT